MPNRPPWIIGRNYNVGKIAQAACVPNDKLDKINIQGESFLLLLITEGSASFQVGEEYIEAQAPCFVCFDESADPVLLHKRKLRCRSIYFHPQFLNVNMSFELIRTGFYGDIAHTHDMFLLRPFLDHRYIVPIAAPYLDKVTAAFDDMHAELKDQRDWYWSCRSRSYFMEIIISLERLYGLMERGDLIAEGRSSTVKDDRVKRALLFIESHYAKPLTLSDIVQAAESNHTTLSLLFSREIGLSPMEYLWRYRIGIAKKLLAFTEIPQKDISARCGFKTVPHFSRMFREHTGLTPAEFRCNAVKARKEEMAHIPLTALKPIVQDHV